MSTTSAAQLARLRTQFPDWDIIRTRCGTFVAHHRITGERVMAHSLAELQTLLREWGMRR
jgi:hypothetical protein